MIDGGALGKIDEFKKPHFSTLSQHFVYPKPVPKGVLEIEVANHSWHRLDRRNIDAQ